MGPMTGRAAGYCAGYAAPGFANPVGGRGFGFGRGMGWGRGRGRRNGFYATGLPGWQRFGAAAPPAAAAPYAAGAAPEQQIELLKGQAEYLADALDGVRQRIDEIEKRQADEAK